MYLLAETKEELRKIIEQRIKGEGYEVDLNDIDVSKITDMSYLFVSTNFNGDISRWDVSNVTDIHSMFSGCKNFNGDISGWNVSNVTNMCGMFSGCKNFKSPYVGLCYDVGHDHYWRVQDWLGLFGDRVFALHLHDNFADKDSHFIPFDACKKSCKSLKYDECLLRDSLCLCL